MNEKTSKIVTSEIDLPIALPFINNYIRNFHLIDENRRIPHHISEALKTINEECWRIAEITKSFSSFCRHQ